MTNKKLTIKEITIIFLFILTLGLIAFSIIKDSKTNKLKEEQALQEQSTPSVVENEYCYYQSTKSGNGFYDVSWLKVKEKGEYISGEFRNLPAEKDSKVGTFEGLKPVFISDTGVKQADVIWDTLAEGMQNREELMFDYSDLSATAYFGESKDSGDGVYMFTNKSNLFPQSKMDIIDCDELDEKLNVEKYVRSNIVSLSQDKEVLGGRWYVTSLNINPLVNTGEVVYEDGHIEAKASFVYDYKKETGDIIINDFKQIK